MKVRFRRFKNKEELENFLRSIGNTEAGAQILSTKGETLLIEVDGIDTRGANILKQDAISVGADCAVPRKASSFEKGRWRVLLMANRRQLKKLTEKLKLQPFGLKELAEKIEKALLEFEKESFKLVYRGKVLNLDTPKVMGILNVTPDSFSDGGLFSSVEAAVKRCRQMLQEGAHIIDVGGESTRPGSEPVPEKEEMERVIPVIRALRRELGEDFFISVDTYKSAVAEAALGEGADIVNDISAFRFDPKMAEVVARYGCPAVVMHIKGTPKNMQKNPYYKDVVGEIIEYFQEVFSAAESAGVKREQLIVDPGIGFGKRLEDNLCILKRLQEFKVLGRPLLVGASRKSFIGAVTGVKEPKERLAGSLGAVAAAYYGGAKLFRVHDVKETVELLKLLTAVEGVDC
ncbi:dihydropteroate synthase [Thermovibrio ammonificans]